MDQNEYYRRTEAEKFFGLIERVVVAAIIMIAILAIWEHYSPCAHCVI